MGLAFGPAISNSDMPSQRQYAHAAGTRRSLGSNAAPGDMRGMRPPLRLLPGLGLPPCAASPRSSLSPIGGGRLHWGSLPRACAVQLPMAVRGSPPGPGSSRRFQNITCTAAAAVAAGAAMLSLRSELPLRPLPGPFWPQARFWCACGKCTPKLATSWPRGSPQC